MRRPLIKFIFKMMKKSNDVFYWYCDKVPGYPCGSCGNCNEFVYRYADFIHENVQYVDMLNLGAEV